MRLRSQITRDANRDMYLVAFPPELSADRVLAWLRSISGALPHRVGLSTGSLVFETWASPRGITWRLAIPSGAAQHIASQLRTLAPGVTVTKDTDREEIDWTVSVSIGMTSPSRQLRIANPSDLAASLLASVQALRAEEATLIQWVITPAPYEPLPAKDASNKSNEFSFKKALFGSQHATGDELQDRRGKLDEQNVLAMGRIVARADSEKRATQLVDQVWSALKSANSANRFKIMTDHPKVGEAANAAATPLLFPGQFNLKELAAVIGWPIGQPFVAGLPQGSTRHLYATENVLTEGRILGDSNYPGHERPIAVSYDYAVQHMITVGANGTGKSVLMANCLAQDLKAGYGAIVVDAANSFSSETLFSRALQVIPPERADDVIVLDVVEDADRPVGLNLLDQGSPRIVADQIKDLFSHLYNDTSGVWTKQLLYHGIYTLSERPGMTLADLMPLLNRQTKDEIAWADELIRSVKDKELRNFWQRWENFNQSERDRYTQPLLNRIWQLVSRPEARGIIGQSKSSFDLRDVLKNNKILLINLAGLAPDTANVLGTLIVNAITNAAYSMRPDMANFLYLDEFQVLTRSPLGLDDMLRRTRKHNLGLVMGTQFLSDAPVDLKRAVLNNAATVVVFKTSSEEANLWRSEFGKTLDINDFTRIARHEAIARVATDGVDTAVTMRARPQVPSTGIAAEIRRASRERFGRRIEDVEVEMVARRASVKTDVKRPSLGIDEWK